MRERRTATRLAINDLDLVTDRLVADDCARGCLVGDLSVEAPGHSTALRERLLAIYNEWTGMFAEWIEQAQADGWSRTGAPVRQGG